MPPRLLALQLADSRLPSGAHAHSGGIEQAVDGAVVFDVASLRAWCEGRLATNVTLEAHVAALAWQAARSGDARLRLELLSEELDARLAAPAARSASRRQGAQFVRTTTAMLGLTEPPCGPEPHLCLAVGVIAAACGLAAGDAAAIAVHQALSGAASAGLRLLGLDPVAVSGILAELAPLADAAVDSAVEAAAAGWEPAALPALQAPALDLLLEIHHARAERLFAS